MEKNDQLILIVGIILIFLGIQYAGRNVVVPEPSPKPDTPVVVPVVPKLITNILYDDYDKAIELTKVHNRPLVLIFSASWCPYCKDLKNDIESIKQFNKTIVCVIDAEKNRNFVDKFDIKGLPTSIIFIKNEEKSRHSGYIKDGYEKWLDGNLS